MKVNFSLFGADSKTESKNGGKSVIRLFGVTKDGKSVLAFDRNFFPYLYAVPSDVKVKEKIKSFPEVKEVMEVEKKLAQKQTKALQIFAFKSADLQKIRDRLKKMEEIGRENCYEYGIGFKRRYLIDKRLKPGLVKARGSKEKSNRFDLKLDLSEIKLGKGFEEIPLKQLAFDLESYEAGGERKIIMISLAASGFEKVLTWKEGKYPAKVEVLANEKELIKRFVELIEKKDPDFLISYNGDEYDFKLLRERANEYGIKLKLGRDGSSMKFVRRGRKSAAMLAGRLHLDLYNFVSNILAAQLETEVLTLNAVAAELLGESKIEMELEEILEHWRKEKDLAKLAQYCLKDSLITLRLGKQLIPQIFALSREVGQLPFDCSRMTYGQLVELFLIRKAWPSRIAPNRPKWKEIQQRRKEKPFKGGFVKEPEVGLHESLAVFDFKSLYPTIICSYNISPETLNCKCCKDLKQIPSKKWFCKKKKGFIPSQVEGLIKERSKLKDEMRQVEKDSTRWINLNNRQYALKILANSAFGYYGYAGARWYSRDCARSITSLGRKWIKKVMNQAESNGFKVIYGDTDSLMITDGDTSLFLEKVNKKLPEIMELELEGEFTRGLFVRREKGKGAKKRYALADEKGNLKIRGFETVRRDWCRLAKRVQRKVLCYILREASKEKAIKYVSDIVKRIREKEIDLRSLIIYTQLKKPIKEYESIGPHVVAAKKLLKEGKQVEVGSVIMFLITKGKGSISDRATPYELCSLEEIDPSYYIKHQIVPAAMRVLKALSVKEEELLGRTTLEEFF